MFIDIIYDLETYPNVFTAAFEQADTNDRWFFEISDRVNQSRELAGWLTTVSHHKNIRLVGFNNIGFDYPILHLLITMGYANAIDMYQKSQAIFNSERGSFAHVIWENERIVPQLDLYKIHHFDNVSRSTSLKVLEFNMRSENIEDLPFEPGTIIPLDQIDTLISYNWNDIIETKKFYHHSLDAIKFREELTEKYGKSFMNHNDTKIGKDYFIMKLEELLPGSCYVQSPTGKKIPRQTIRSKIHLAEAVFPYIQFVTPEFNRIHKWFCAQTITETKGIFKDLNATIDDFQFHFGLGGIHGSVESQTVISDDEWVLIDVDVASYYPNLAIVNRVYPEHLSESFCDIYKDVFEQRKKHPKGTPENAVLKLALNGVYGDSNNQYSSFYDSLYTMKITINGQLLLCMLAEQLILGIKDLQMIQINTDGLTVKVKREYLPTMNLICEWWENFTCLTLEHAEYSHMWIRDVNNYIARGVDGKLKRKGAYCYGDDLEWHQNHSSQVIAKAAEAALVHGTDITEFITKHENLYDFMLRAKVPHNSKLVLSDGEYDFPLQNITRYYITHDGGSLVKIMPPLARSSTGLDRRIGIAVGWKVTPCNNITDATIPINYDYYIQETKKLVEPLK